LRGNVMVFVFLTGCVDTGGTVETFAAGSMLKKGRKQ